MPYRGASAEELLAFLLNSTDKVQAQLLGVWALDDIAADVVPGYCGQGRRGQGQV